MRKYLQITIVLGVFFLLVLLRQMHGDDEPHIRQLPQSASAQPPQQTTQPSQTTTTYKDGTYTGNIADAYYGNLQVQTVISGGKISDVVFLQYPNDNRTSVFVNTQAMPVLKSEAIQAQNAKVDIVTGASQSSIAFQQSLASALQQAQ